jgi:predicted component of type VI protein secretion system
MTYCRIAKVFFLLALFALVVLSGCQKHPGSESNPQPANTKRVTVEITGMT